MWGDDSFDRAQRAYDMQSDDRFEEEDEELSESELQAEQDRIDADNAEIALRKIREGL